MQIREDLIEFKSDHWPSEWIINLIASIKELGIYIGIYWNLYGNCKFIKFTLGKYHQYKFYLCV